jgi:hypothetical protein
MLENIHNEDAGISRTFPGLAIPNKDEIDLDL